MINLRYHIVSLTAVFLAIGIGLTLGSTFLDRATVDNLRGQLDTLEGRLQERERQIGELEARVEEQDRQQDALDEQASGLLSGTLDAVPVLVVSARGADDDDVQQLVASLAVADAEVQGIWWLTDRWNLEDDGAINDLATALEIESTDPSRLRRTAIAELGGELRARQLLAGPTSEAAEEDDGAGESGAAETGEAGGASGDAATEDTVAAAGAPTPIPLVEALVDAGFIEFEAVSGGPSVPLVPDGTRLALGAGSAAVPDDVVIEPLIERMVRASETPLLGVLGSVRPEEGELADAVLVVRDDETLRTLVPTVDLFEHFEGWAAGVLALAEVGDGVVGHYGLDETASRLLPPVRSP